MRTKLVGMYMFKSTYYTNTVQPYTQHSHVLYEFKIFKPSKGHKASVNYSQKVGRSYAM